MVDFNFGKGFRQIRFRQRVFSANSVWFGLESTFLGKNYSGNIIFGKSRFDKDCLDKKRFVSTNFFRKKNRKSQYKNIYKIYNNQIIFRMKWTETLFVYKPSRNDF
jgi:hypothetical protein